MTPPAKAGGFSEERLLAPTAASQATAQVSPCGHLSRLAPESPIRALKRGTPGSPQGLTARYVLRTPRFRACNPLALACWSDTISLTADWHELLLQAHRTYVADVDALLEERRHLLETIAALRRVAVAAEAALFESRAGQQGKRLEALLRALEMAGYGQQENTATQITARTSG